MKTDVNINKIYERNELIWGVEAQKLLFQKHVMVFGLGGVGSYAAEALARSGVGKLTLVDFDTVAESNINRQLIALLPDVGESKAELMKKRIENINPHIQINLVNEFYTLKLNEQLFSYCHCERSEAISKNIDFVIDAIDSLKSKVDLIETCINLNIPIISSMGAGNRLDPGQLYIADLSEINAKKCPFAKNVAYRLKSRGITQGLPVVASHEKPSVVERKETIIHGKNENGEDMEFKKITPGSSPFVPPVAGYMMASYVVRKFISKK